MIHKVTRKLFNGKSTEINKPVFYSNFINKANIKIFKQNKNNFVQ